MARTARAGCAWADPVTARGRGGAAGRRAGRALERARDASDTVDGWDAHGLPRRLEYVRTYLDPGDAYPQVLERLIAESERLAPVEVLNLGFPGTNSSRLRNALPRIVRELRPDVVMVMIGGNDWWTEPDPTPDGRDAPTWADRLYHHSRVYRLLYMIARSLRPPQRSVVWREGASISGGSGTIRYGGAAFDWGWTRRPDGVADWTTRLRENLLAIAVQARASSESRSYS